MRQQDYSIYLGDTSLLEEYGLIMTKKYISPPEPKTKLIDVPNRNGAIDLSEILTGHITYEQREIEVEFYTKEKPENFTILRSTLQSKFHGKSFHIIFDDDLNYYWDGRVTIDFENDGYIGTVKLNAIVDPYKKSVTDTSEDWLWDPFDFEYGVVNELSSITVSGTKDVIIALPNEESGTSYPIITTNANMSVTYEGETVSLKTGTTTIYDFTFHSGDNTLTFKGNGTITIAYRGESL